MLPSAIERADDVLPLARSLIDADADRLIATEPVSCRAGCSACCAQAVPVRPAEVRAVRSHLDQLEEGDRTELAARVADAVGRLRAAGVGEPPADPAKRRAMVQRYFEAGVACPFLTAEGVCGIRAVRPLACREYLMTSDPEHCGTDGAPVVRIRSSRDLLAGFAKVSSALGEPDVDWLVFALAGPAPTAPPSKPLSGVHVSQVLLGQRRARDDS